MEPERPFPGGTEFAGWRFLYLQAVGVEQFLKLFDEIGEYIERHETAFPEGGFGTTGSRLTLPDGRSLYGLSLRGSLDTFERRIRAFATERGLAVAEVKGSRVILGLGDALNLDACRPSYYDF